MCDYLRILLQRGRDPLLDVGAWYLFRVCAPRMTDLFRLDELGANPERPSVCLTGKRSTSRVPVQEMPVHRPLVQFICDLSSARPGPHPGPLLRTPRGNRISEELVEGWSQALHANARWAQGHMIRVHALRVASLRLVERTNGAHALGAKLWGAIGSGTS